MEVESTSVKLRSLGLSTAEREIFETLIYRILSVVEIRQAEILEHLLVTTVSTNGGLSPS